MIRFEGVKKVYPGNGKTPDILALNDVNLHIRKGEFVFVLGHSGAGKSTFLKLILREEEAASSSTGAICPPSSSATSRTCAAASASCSRTSASSRR